MYLLIIILNREEFLEELMEVLVELGITDATVVESQSMGKVLAYEVPIFAGLRFQTKGQRRYSKTILALVDDRQLADEIVQLLQEMDIDFMAPGVGRIVTIKVESALGAPSELEAE